MKNKIILVIFVLALLSSIALTLSTTEKICGNVCTSIEKAKYDSFLGIKNAHLGLFIFAFLSIITISHIKAPKKNKKKLINIGIVFGSIIAIYFLYIQAFVLKEFCKYCMIIDIGMIINLFLIIPKRKNENNTTRSRSKDNSKK